MNITICAFTDNQPNSVAYKKFNDIEKAVEFYKKQLERDCVNVISTRCINKDLPKFKDIMGLFKDNLSSQ